MIVGEVKFGGAATRLDNDGYLAELHRLIDELGLGDAVEFAGEREDVPELMAEADVLLAPSTEEPFGRTVVEAMAVETPVVATSVGGPSEVIDDGVTGLLVAPENPIAWSQAIRKDLGQTRQDSRDESPRSRARASSVCHGAPRRCDARSVRIRDPSLPRLDRRRWYA